MSRKGARGIVVSAASKLPSSKAGQGISRVDIYVNNRPVRSIDAQEGVVRSTQVTIGKERKQAGDSGSRGLEPGWKTCRISPDSHPMIHHVTIHQRRSYDGPRGDAHVHEFVVCRCVAA